MMQKINAVFKNSRETPPKNIRSFIPAAGHFIF